MKQKGFLITLSFIITMGVMPFVYSSEEVIDERKVSIDWYYEMSRLERILGYLVELMEDPEEDKRVFADLWNLVHERVRHLRLFSPNLTVGEYEWGVIELDHKRVFSERDALEKELQKVREENSALKDQLLVLLDEKVILTEQIEELKLEVKQWQQVAQSKETPSKREPEIDADFYVVQQGDSLWKISRLTGVPLDTLRELNDIEGSDLQVGQKLRLTP